MIKHHQQLYEVQEYVGGDDIRYQWIGVYWTYDAVDAEVVMASLRRNNFYKKYKIDEVSSAWRQ